MQNGPYRKAELKIKELNQKIRIHKFKSILLILLIVALCLMGGYFAYDWYEGIHYTDYQVLESIPREDASGTRFLEFQGNILKYNNDGALYIDARNQLIWNRTYEIHSPEIDICEDFLVIYDRGGRNIYIMDIEGGAGQITTTMPIVKASIANQGTVAVLMESEGVGYIHLYDRDGAFLAEGVLHTQNSGYPLDISLSNDGRQMAVSLLNMNEGSLSSTLAFYDFGTVGQNQIDNMVGALQYPGMIIPRVEHLTNDVIVAVGDSSLMFFDARRIPTLKETVEKDTEIQSIFFNERYMGVVSLAADSEETYKVDVYDLAGSLVNRFDFSMDYREIDFLENNNISIRNDLEASIFTLRGTQRFHYNFEHPILKIMSQRGLGRRFLFIMEDKTERVRLRRG